LQPQWNKRCRRWAIIDVFGWRFCCIAPAWNYSVCVMQCVL